MGCTPANNPNNTSTLVINATTKHFSHVNIVGSDEVWFNKGDKRYYTGSNRNCKTTAPCPTAATQAAVLGVIDGTSVLIETIPQSSGSHSVAADSKRDLNFVPQSAPVAVVGVGGDTTDVGAGICGSTNGCVGVYVHDVDKEKKAMTGIGDSMRLESTRAGCLPALFLYGIARTAPVARKNVYCSGPALLKRTLNAFYRRSE